MKDTYKLHIIVESTNYREPINILAKYCIELEKEIKEIKKWKQKNKK